MQVQSKSKGCACKRDELAKLQLLYKDDSEYNECYAEDWEERNSFKKLLRTTQDIPIESARCNCILQCDAAKIKGPRKTNGSHMELPWAAITIPERCDAEPKSQISKQNCPQKLSLPKAIVERSTKQTAAKERKLKCDCKVEQQSTEEQKPKYVIQNSTPKSVADERKLKCTCKLHTVEEKLTTLPIEKVRICERKQLENAAEELAVNHEHELIMNEHEQKCNCKQKTIKPCKRMQPKGKCTCKQQAQQVFIEEQLKHSYKEQMQKPATQGTKLTCECKPNPRELPSNFSEDSKQIKPVIKTFTCPGGRSTREVPTRIPIPVIDTQHISREEEEEISTLKPSEKEKNDILQPPTSAQKGICNCETDNTKLSHLEQQSEIQRDDSDQNNGDPEPENTNEAPTNNEDTSQRQQDADKPQAAEQSSSAEGEASGSGTGATGGDDGKQPPEKDNAMALCLCSLSETSMDEERKCLEESERNPMKLVYDNLCYEANEPYMDPLSKIYPDDCETYCGPCTEIPWSEILIPKGVKLRQARKSKRKKCKTTRSTNTDANINEDL